MNRLNKQVKCTIFFIMIFLIRVVYCIYVYNFKYNYFSNEVIKVTIQSINKVTEQGITYNVKYNNDKFLMYMKNNDNSNLYKYGDELKVIASNYEIEKLGNPYEFDYKKYLNSNNIISSLYCTKILEVKENSGGCLKLIYKLQEMISNKLEELIDEKNSNILKSIIYGDDTFLDSDIKNKFINIGIGHFLCVSGTHVMFLLLAYEKIMQSKNKVILKIILLVYFYFISLFNISLLRAIIMFFLSNIKKKLSFIQKYVICLYIILIINPYYIFNIGVLFSFLSLLSIKIFYSMVNSIVKNKMKIKNKFIIYIIDNISLTISSQILILPLQVFYFGKITIICLLSNLILGFTLDILLFTGFSLFILFFIPGISNILIYLCNLLVNILILQVDFLESINYFTITMPKPNILFFICYYLIIIIFLYGKKFSILFWKKRRVIKKVLCYTNIICIIFCIYWYIKIMYFEKYIIFFNVGQGNMALLHNNVTNIIIDIGSTDKSNAGNIIVNFLKAKNIKNIDCIFLTHTHSDHINGIEKLIENGIEIKRIGYLEPYEMSQESQELQNIIKTNKIAKLNLKEGDKIKIDGVQIDILSPLKNNYIKDEDITNANSIVYLINYNNKNCLFMGDATKNTEKYILNKYIFFKYEQNESILEVNRKLKKLECYQVGHHGSKTSTSEEFIENISSCYAIISADEDVYGHPHSEVTELLKKYKFKIFITKKNGAIKL